jgi:hypothetical protein
MMLPIPRSGRFTGIAGGDAALAIAGVTALDVTLPVGSAVRSLPDGDRYLGFLFATGETPAAVEASLRRGAALLEIGVEPADERRDAATVGAR